jgi:hypothetical protein
MIFFKLQEKKKFENLIFISILVNFISIAITYSLLTPSFEGPDEGNHYLNSIWLFNENLRPSDELYYRDIGAPLYYIYNSIIFHLLHPSDIKPGGLEANIDYWTEFIAGQLTHRWNHGYEEIFPFQDVALTLHTMRIFSIFLGCITLIFVYKIAKLVFLNNKNLALYSMAIVSLVPTFLFINSVLNTDVLVWTLSTITIFYILKFVNEPKNVRWLVLTAIFASLSIATKPNGLVLYPIFLITVVYLIMSKRTTLQFALKQSMLFGLFSIVSISWLWIGRVIRNIDFQNTSITKIFYSATGLSTQGIPGLPGIASPVGQGLHFESLYDLGLLHSRFIDYAFGGLWHHTIWPNKSYLVIADVLLLVSLVGLVFLFLKRNTLYNLNLKKTPLVVVLSAAIIMISYMYINFISTDIGVARYTFPVISCFGILFSLGWYVLVFNKKNLKLLLFIPIIFLLILNLNLLIIMAELPINYVTSDSDNDGIINELDLAPSEYSNYFNDQYFGGNTFGNIIKRSNQTISVFYDPKSLGVSISLQPSSELKDTEINACYDTFSLSSGDKLTFSCKEGKLNVIKHYEFSKNLPLDIKDGDLIQGNDQMEVYLIQNKMKRHITNPTVFQKLGFTPDMIKFVPNEIINQILDGKSIVNMEDL